MRSNSSRSSTEVSGSPRRSSRIFSCIARPSACCFAAAAPFFFDCASAWKRFSSSSRAIRSGVAWKLSRNEALDSDLAEAEVGRRVDPAHARFFFLPSFGDLACVAILAMLECSEDFHDVLRAVERISRRLSPRLLRMGTQKEVALMSCTLPLRACALRLVTTHT